MYFVTLFHVCILYFIGCLNEEAAEQKRSLEYTVEEVTQKYSESLNKISSLNSTIQEQASSIKNMKV